MRIVTNSKLAARNRKIATNMFLLTFVLLIGGFIFINIGLFTGDAAAARDPLLLTAQFIAIPLAFVLTLFSIRMTNLWARRPYPDEAINEGLKGLSKKSVIYHYYHIPARHVLFSPQGIFAITTRWHNGKYSVEGNRWRTKAGPMTRLFATLRMDGVGQPTLDAQNAAEHLQKLLADVGITTPVQPIIVFLDSKAQVDATNSEVPVVFASIKHENSLTDYLRDLSREAEPAQKRSDKGKKSAEAANKGAVMPITEQQIAAFEAKTVDKSQASVTESA
jgi:hypothetical protein